MTLVAKVEVAAGDPLLALEAISPNSVVVGAASGQLVELLLEQPNVDDPAGVAFVGAQQIQLRPPLGAGHCSAVCGIATDHEVTPRQFLVCHARTWAWPESHPQAAAPGCCRTSSLCLDLLSA